MENRKRSVRERLRDAYSKTVLTRAELLESGATPRDITAAVRAGSLQRLRRDRYASPAVDEEAAEAVRIGGRVTCLSLMHSIGVFVLSCTSLHVHIRPGMSRIRAPKAKATVLHWDTWSGEDGPLHAVGLGDAVRHAIRCQAPRAAIATLDSVLHHRLMTMTQLREVFEALPVRFHVLLTLLDASAESGPETFMRLILRALGVRFQTQVVIPGVGRVDFLVDGWLIIECDSREFHEGWEKQVEDRERDMAAACLGLVTVRPLATDIMHSGQTVRDAISTVLRTLGPRLSPTSGRQIRGRSVHNSAESDETVGQTPANRLKRGSFEEL